MTVLYRIYRPQKFSDLVGQEAIAQNLLAQLESGKFSHAYLFYGPKGTGKTSTARIFAKAVNCEVYRSSSIVNRKNKNAIVDTRSTISKYGEPCNKCASCLAITNGSHLDLIEIDAASNRGIDEIRDLREKIKLSPINGRFKVYIIDEAHMLTSEAFNALLKTLEEPPAHAIFILCTTEFGKLPQTIVSRMQKFHFARAGGKDLVKVVEKIAKAEGVKIENGAAAAIAEIADGSYRDAVSIFDQLSSQKKITVEDVGKIGRVGGWNQMYTFVENLADKKLKEAILALEKISNEGADISYFAKQAVLFLEKLLFLKIGILDAVADYSQDQIERTQKLTGKFSSQNLQNLMKLILVAESEMKLYPLPQIPLVLAVCKFIPQEEVREAGNVREVQKVREVSQVSPHFVPQGGTSRGKQVSEVSEPKADRPLDEKKSDKSDKSKNLKRQNKTESAAKSGPQKATTQSSNGQNVKVAAKANPKSLKVITANWEKFLGRVKSINAHVVALLRSSRPIVFDGSDLTLEVFYRFHKEKLEEPRIVKMLDDIMGDIISTPVKLRFVLAAKGDRPPPSVEKSNVVDIDSADIAKMAQEIFSK